MNSADAGHDEGSPASSADHFLLWGMGSDDLPIDAGVAEMHIRQKIGCPEDTRDGQWRSFGGAGYERGCRVCGFGPSEVPDFGRLPDFPTPPNLGSRPASASIGAPNSLIKICATTRFPRLTLSAPP